MGGVVSRISKVSYGCGSGGDMSELISILLCFDSIVCAQLSRLNKIVVFRLEWNRGAGYMAPICLSKVAEELGGLSAMGMRRHTQSKLGVGSCVRCEMLLRNAGSLTVTLIVVVE